MTELTALRAALNALRAMVGVIFAYAFFDNAFYDRYSAAGYQKLIGGYIQRDNSGILHPLFRFPAEHATFFAPLQAVAEIAIAIGLIAGIASPLTSLAGGGLLAGLFAAEAGLFWTWELPPSVVVCAAVVFASLPALRSRGVRAWLTERPNAAFLALPQRLGIAAGSGLLVWFVLHWNGVNDDIAWQTALATVVLLAVGAALDNRDASKNAHLVPDTN